MFGRCELAADSVDTEKRTVEVVFLSGEPIARVPLFEDAYFLEFDVSKKAADLSRLNAGAAVLDSHNGDRGLGAVLGRVERAWIQGGKAYATLRFSKRPDVDGVWQDIQDGILTSVSAGLYLEEVEELEPHKGSDMQRYAVRRWQPYELSIVGIPADAGAKIQASADTKRHPCRLTLMEDIQMRFTKCPNCSERLSADVEETCPHCEMNLDDADATRKEDKRIANVHRVAEHYELDDVWTARHVNLGLSNDEVIAAAVAEKNKRHPIGPNHIGFGDDYDSPGSKVELMSEGVAARARGTEPSDGGRCYRMSTLVELAYEMLSWTGKHRGLDCRHHAARIMELALHTTSDFPLLLANALNKMLQPEYEAAAPTYRQWCALRSFNDFRPHHFLRSGDFPDLLEVNEHGEIKYGTIGENDEVVTAANYARIFAISRHVLVNDDLAAFTDLASKVARRVADFENGLAYTLLTSGSGLGPDLSDTKTLFHADHNNVGTGTIDVTNVGLGVAAMMKSEGLGGVKLNVEPTTLLTSPDRLAVARQFVAQNLSPTQPSEANPFANLMAIADANLTTAAPWYLFADPAAAPAFVYGYIGGVAGPRVDTRAGWEVEGAEMRVSLDFGVGAIDSRGAFRSTGA